MRLAYDREFSHFHYYHSGNLARVYMYLNMDVSAGDVVGLQSDQVTKSSVLSFHTRLSFVILKLIRCHLNVTDPVETMANCSDWLSRVCCRAY